MVVILRVRPALWPCQLPTWGVGCQPDQPLDRPVSAFPEAWGREVLGRGAVPAIRITHGRIPGGIWSYLVKKKNGALYLIWSVSEFLRLSSYLI